MLLYKKPILFIYSDELLLDKEMMYNINGMAHTLGTKAININDIPKDIENYLTIDELKYAAYERDVLTSRPLGKPNYQIIIDEIM